MGVPDLIKPLAPLLPAEPGTSVWMGPALGTIIDNGVGAGKNGACPGSDPDCTPPGETPGAEPCGRVEGVGAESGESTCAFCTLTFSGGNVT